MLSDGEIIQLFKDSVAEVASPLELDNIAPTAEIADLGLDSITTMEVISVMEEKLDLRFANDDLATLRNISGLIAMVRRSR